MGTEVTKLGAAKYAALSDAEKAKYLAIADENMAKYREQMKDYTPPERDEEEETRPSKKQKKVKDPNAPKRPVGGAFGVFLSENRSDIQANLKEGQKMVDVAKIASVRFKALSPN